MINKDILIQQRISGLNLVRLLMRSSLSQLIRQSVLNLIRDSINSSLVGDSIRESIRQSVLNSSWKDLKYEK